MYLDISGHNFPKISQSIKFFCLYHNTSYILRHVDVRSKTIDLLGGYGVELISKDDIEPQTDFDYKILYDFYKLLPDWKSVNQRIENSQYKYSDFTEEFKNDTLIYSRKNRKYEEKGLLLINNLYVPADFFIVLGTLRALNNALIGLKDLHIPHTIAVKILNKFNLEFSIKSNKYVITNSKSGRVYINDLENDKKYANWSEDLNQFLMPYGFRLDKIAKNIFNLIAVINLQHKAA